MTTRQKLEIIQKMLGLTQTKLAERFGVSFAAFNSWWTGKSEPRAKAFLMPTFFLVLVKDKK